MTNIPLLFSGGRNWPANKRLIGKAWPFADWQLLDSWRALTAFGVFSLRTAISAPTKARLAPELAKKDKDPYRPLNRYSLKQSVLQS